MIKSAYDKGVLAALEHAGVKTAAPLGMAGKALVGAGLGAGAGALNAGEGNRFSGALRGAAVGGALGAGAHAAQNAAYKPIRQFANTATNKQMALLGLERKSDIAQLASRGIGYAGGAAALGAGALAGGTAYEPTWKDRLRGVLG